VNVMAVISNRIPARRHLQSGSGALIIARYALSGMLAVALPLLLDRLPPHLVRDTYGPHYRVYELFGLSGALFILFNAWIEVRRYSPETTRDWLAVLLPVLVAFQALFTVSEFTFRSYDYNMYQAAADALLRGGNPYADAYLYPPVLAQIMGIGYRTIVLFAAPDVSSSPQMIWNLVFYFYRCLQFFAVIAAYWLCYRFSYELGMSRTTSFVVVTVLFAVNSPIVRTLRHGQINLLLLVCVLSAILLLQRRPVLGGLLLSFGGLIKLYPFFLGLPCLMARKWRALAGMALCVVLLLAAQLSIGQGLTVWRQFVLSVPNFHERYVFRDNSIRGLVVNTARVARVPSAGFINGLMLVLTVFIGLLFVMRSWRRINQTPSPAPDSLEARTLSHTLAADALGFMILLSPLVWEHHFVLLLPLSIWALSIHKRQHFSLIVLANVLIYLIPTFDVFPLSYHRLAGLCILLYCTGPRHAPLVRTLA
jgi:hypothetical protein